MTIDYDLSARCDGRGRTRHAGDDPNDSWLQLNGLHQTPEIQPPAKPGSQPYLDLLDELKALHISKDHDYSGLAVPFSNFRKSVKIGVKPSTGCYIRMQDKWSRLQNLLALEMNGEAPSNESIEDNLKDLAAYALIQVTLRKEGN